jgi:hypothetical protein
MPVLFSIPLFLTQCTSLFIRLRLDWKNSQLLSFILAIAAIALTIVAYKSTHLDAAEVYIWTPVSLIVDIGTLIHWMVCILRDPGERFWMPATFKKPLGGSQGINKDVELQVQTIPLAEYPEQLPLVESPVQHEAPRPRKWSTTAFCIAVLSLVFLVVLQIVGLVAAFQSRNDKVLVQSWCSPAFQLGYEAFDSVCQTFPIAQQQKLGIACVNVPSGPTGSQGTWLWMTGVILILQLGIEGFEMVVLFTPRRYSPTVANWRAKHGYKAPVVTMVFGGFVMLVLVIIGWIQMTSLPAGLNSGVLGLIGSDFIDGTTNTRNASCLLTTYAGGVRGTLLAWTDGIFTGIKGYDGTPPQ